MNSIITFDQIFDCIDQSPDLHAPGTPVYSLLANVAKEITSEAFSSPDAEPTEFGPFGELRFPFFSMGAISSLHLFGLDELILFAFYRSNRNRYRRVADIGANIGLHSIMLGRCGYDVRAFEPDPFHREVLERNLQLNGCDRVEIVPAAVSSTAGELEFVRVLGNTTGSHLAGSKKDPYGDLDRFQVPVEPIGPIMQWADFLKIDAEGHEAEIICATSVSDWDGTDAVVEVGSRENADAIYSHLSSMGVRMFAQSLNWAEVTTPEQIPTHYSHGLLFVSKEVQMNWDD
jgi:FkbM family methyltransferase